MQPVKNTINYKDFLSNELRNVFNEMATKIIKEYPVNEVDSDYFLFATLDNKDTMLYKALNGFLSEISIDNIYKSIYEKVTGSKIITALKPGREIPYSTQFRIVLGGSYYEMKKTNNALITSDHVLLSILLSNEEIAELFNREGLTYEILRDESIKLHKTLDEINGMPQPKNIEIKVINGDPNFDISNVINSITGQNKGHKPSTFNNFCTNLNEEASKGKIDTLVGRENEIEHFANIIERKKCNNVVIVGKSGVGKTQFIEGIAKMINDSQGPIALRPFNIYRLNVYELMSGTSLRGMFEERVNSVLKELKKKNTNILFIDDFHNFCGDKKKEEYDIVGLLGDILSDGTIKVVITTNQRGYRSIFDNNNTLIRQFQRIDLNPPSVEETIEILSKAKHPYEEFHRVKYTDKAIETCAKLSERYITERNLPASAFDILDEAGVIKKREVFEPKELTQKLGNLKALMDDKNNCVINDDMEKARELDSVINETKLELTEYCDIMKQNEDMFSVTEDDVLKAISNATNIPLEKVNLSDINSLSTLDKTLQQYIVGQDEAIELVSKSIKRNKIGLGSKNRPIFSCMCIGNTGCGKTLMAKTLAQIMFGDEKNMIRFDMSEYADKTSVNKLIGSSAGYIGYDKGGLLTEAVRNKKHCVLLIDEIEKANSDVYNLFLQILDEGFLTDNSGNKVDFKNTIIIITSNVGAKRASLQRGIGFNVDDNVNKKSIIEKELKKKFPPEFINRLDEVVYFNNLTDDNIKDIAHIEMGKLVSNVKEIGYSMEYDEGIIDIIANKALKKKEYGARPILRIIRKDIEDVITDNILNHYDDDVIEITIKDFNIKLKKQE